MPRRGANSHKTKPAKRNTQHKAKGKKEEKKQQFANDQKKSILYKNRSQRILELFTKLEKIKDVEMEQDIDFEHLDSEIFDNWENVMTNKDLNFVFVQRTNLENF